MHSQLAGKCSSGLQHCHFRGNNRASSSFLALQFTFLQDDVGIPLNYRHMEGFGVHTFTLINKEGKITYVKFHWKPTCGVKCLLEDEAVQVGGSNHSHATKVCTGCTQSNGLSHQAGHKLSVVSKTLAFCA